LFALAQVGASERAHRGHAREQQHGIGLGETRLDAK
jgi:hypothetical protein